jgi:hypothetical protein
MLEDNFEEEEKQQQQPASAEVAITNNGQQNQPTALLSVFLWPKKGHSVPDVKWELHGPLFCGISHKSKFLIYHPFCEYCVS